MELVSMQIDNDVETMLSSKCRLFIVDVVGLMSDQPPVVHHTPHRAITRRHNLLTTPRVPRRDGRQAATCLNPTISNELTSHFHGELFTEFTSSSFSCLLNNSQQMSVLEPVTKSFDSLPSLVRILLLYACAY